MTFVVALQGAKSAWLLTDRRLTYAGSQRNDACKMLCVSAIDGTALIGYAGLGKSGLIEPSVWMNDVLVGLHGLSVEAYLGAVASAMQAELPPRLAHMPGRRAQHVVASALVNGEVRAYSIEVEVDAPGQAPYLVFQRHVRSVPGSPSPHLVFAGSGMAHVRATKEWYRSLFHLLSAYESGRGSPLLVADRLAELNENVSVRDAFVSPECIVTWHMNGGDAQFYRGTERINPDKEIPTVASGMDVHELVKLSMPFFEQAKEALDQGQAPPDQSASIQAELDRLELKPKRKI